MKYRFFLLLLFLFLSVSKVSSQSFEGWISYNVEAHNPSPEMIPDSAWQKGIKQQFGERGYMIQKYYYKQNRYLSEIDAGKQSGFQAYNPENGLLYSWQVNADTAITVDSKKYLDKVKEIKDLDKTETILGVNCKAILLDSEMGEMTIWYNENYLKVDPKLFEGHVYGHWEAIVKKIGCLPMKIEQKSMMAHITQTATAYNKEKVDVKKFTIPSFKTVIANPMN